MRAMSKNMKTTVLVFALAVFAGFVTGCEENTQSSSQSSGAVSNPTTTKKIRVSYASPVWPPAGPKDEKLVLAENPLAKNYLVVLDGSGSMDWKSCFNKTETRMDIAKRALKGWGESVPSDANLGLVIFDNKGTTERVAIGKGETNRREFTRQIEDAYANGGTPLHDAVLLGYQVLGKQARRQRGYGEYHLVVVTDGEANAGQDPSQVVSEILATSPITVTTIGFCIGNNHSLNQPGRTVYKEANNPDALKQGLAEVLAESPTFDVKDFNK